MTPKNSERFLDAFVRIEQHLRRVANRENWIGFSSLVDEVAKKDAAVRNYRIKLKEYADLRNAIVHERIDGRPIAEPHDETVLDIEHIASILLQPPRLAPSFLCEVTVCSPGDFIGTVAKTMVNNDFSQIPVYDNGQFRAMLTANTITRWIASELESGIGLLEEKPVEEVLEFQEDNEACHFVKKDDTIFDVLEIFEKDSRAGKSLSAIIITGSGSRSEKPIGILTIADHPRLVRAINYGQD